MPAASLHVTGVVQGVGFRPFVYNLAVGLCLTGWVKNTTDGVYVHAEGPAEVLDRFAHAIREEAPPMAVVDAVTVTEVPAGDHDAFVIVPSEAVEGAMTLVSPDIATCDACRDDFTSPENRRYGYPFTNCTNCGPRFTIIEDVPYDRPLTTMRDFPLCDECAAEYADPTNRRFHAQPNACFRCGPRLYLNILGTHSGVGVPCSDSPAWGPSSPADAPGVLGASPTCGTAPATPTPERPSNPLAHYAWSPEVETTPRPHRDPESERERAAAIIAEAASLLRQGAVVAVKGLGGFQLACDATDEGAVRRLRERKNRWGKPLAVMVPTLKKARAYCEVSEDEAALLESPAAPIVLLTLTDPGALAPSLAPALRELGVMLPYTPLHHLLLSAFGGPLVMTSGNRSDEPIATGNAEALRRLGDIADAFLLHDRDIYSRYDDSVQRITPGVGVEFIRRARGYAPFPLKAPFTSEVDILAAGPEQKNSFALLTGEHAFVSQHIGDMENAETLESYERTIELYERLFRVQPALVAYDLHPEYLSTKYALGLGLPSIGVQHHHAHIASVTAEHGIAERVLGVALDGTGYGTDGTIWGGEWLAADWTGFERVARLRPLPMPGGAAAIRRPARMALGALAECELIDHPGAVPLLSRLAEGERSTLLAMISGGLNTPMTSSMGRLFDAVAALAGVRDDALYEGQAAIELEACADQAAEGSYAFEMREEPDGMLTLDSASVLAAVLEDVAAGVAAATISTRFHRAVVAAVTDTCAAVAPRIGVRHIALAGGVFMNRLVLGGCVAQLEARGLAPLVHRRLPANDGGIAFGQAVVAWARRTEVGR